MLRDALMAEPGVTAVDLFDAFNGTPTLNQLLEYKIVFAFSNNGWQNAVAMGDVLADYMDAGGVVVATTFIWDSRGPWNLQGRYMTGGYTPFNSTSTTLFSFANLGTFNAGHPVMQGVTTLSAFFRNGVTLASGADLIASWSDSSLLIASKNRGVGINAYLGFLNQWSGQFARVTTNTGNWICGGPPPPPPPPPPPATAATTATAAAIRRRGLGDPSSDARRRLRRLRPAQRHVRVRGRWLLVHRAQLREHDVPLRPGRQHVDDAGADGRPITMASAVYYPTTNKIYVFGGWNGVTAFTTTRIYDIATNTWTTGPAMPGGRQQMASGYNPGNGKIYLAGGCGTGNIDPAHDDLWEFNPVAGTFTPKAPMPVGLGVPASGSSAATSTSPVAATCRRRPRHDLRLRHRDQHLDDAGEHAPADERARLRRCRRQGCTRSARATRSAPVAACRRWPPAVPETAAVTFSYSPRRTRGRTSRA